MFHEVCIVQRFELQGMGFATFHDDKDGNDDDDDGNDDDDDDDVFG